MASSNGGLIASQYANEGKAPQMHYLLVYDLTPDYLERRAQYRDEHLTMAWAASEAGELVFGGALTDPVDKAILLFAADSPEVAERFARADPYVRNGLVSHWRVREWTTVVGDRAATPVRPST
jgi:uncharacterized protein YciI